jgi:hypothetical protein
MTCFFLIPVSKRCSVLDIYVFVTLLMVLNVNRGDGFVIFSNPKRIFSIR